MFFFTLLGCAGGLSGGSSSNIGNPNDEAGGGSGLFDEGPIEIPVTIAKVINQLDPSKIDFGKTGGSGSQISAVIKSASAGNVAFTGNAGAATDPPNCPEVFFYNIENDDTATTSVNSDGSFAETSIDFTVEENDLIILACLVDDDSSSSLTKTPNNPITTKAAIADAIPAGKTLGIPLIYNVDGEFWIVTNGSNISTTQFIEDSVIYLINQSSSSSSINALTKNASSGANTLFSLDLGGTATELLSTDIGIDQILAADGNVVIRDGNTFYLVSDGSTTKVLEIDSSVTIKQSRWDPYGKTWIAAASDDAVYLVNPLTGYTQTLYAAEGQMVSSINWGDFIPSTGPLAVLQVSVEEDDGDTAPITKYSLFPRGDSALVAWAHWNDEEAGHAVASGTDDQLINLVGESASRNYTLEVGLLSMQVGDIWNQDLAGGVIHMPSGDYTVDFINKVASNSIPSPSGSAENLYILLGHPFGEVYEYYILNADLEIASVEIETPGFLLKIATVNKTSTVVGAKVHPTRVAVIYCGTAAAGGLYQLFAYFPTEETKNVQLTGVVEGEENFQHCNGSDNWSIDNQTGIISFVNDASTDNAANINITQVNVIDPNADPNFVGVPVYSDFADPSSSLIDESFLIKWGNE